MNYAEKMIAMKRRGIISEAEMLRQLIEHAGYSAPTEIVASIDQPTLDRLKDEVSAGPKSDAEWERSIFVVGGTFSCMSAKEASELAKQKYRKGLEALRDFFNDETK
jgi:hypothetical protein